MLLAFNKPYGVLSQFTRQMPEQRTLAEFAFPKNVYPIGRLDWDSEGLLLLSDEKRWNDRLLHPRHEHPKTYHAQVEGSITSDALRQLEKGVRLKGRLTKPCQAKLLADPGYGPRSTPIRYRAAIPTSWVEIRLTEGRNRQVRRMTAAVGYPTLRLIRVAVADVTLAGLKAGEWRRLTSPFNT